MTLDELMSLTNHKWIAYYTANPEIEQKRQDIAARMPQWGTDWCSAPQGLQQFYGFLNDPALLYTRDQNRRAMLDDLDLDELQDAAGEFEPLEAGEQEGEIPDSARLTWFTTLADEVYLSLRYDAPEWSEPYGMYYRYDREARVYSWNADPQQTPRAWISQEAADDLIVSRAPGPGQEGVEPDRYDGPEWSDPYGMYYRYDRRRGLYEWNREPWLTPAAWISQKQADALIGSQVPPQEAVPAGEAGYSQAAWDENWQMFYRLGSDGVYQYADSSDGAGTGHPGQWLSYSQARELRAGPQRTTTNPGPVEAEAGPVADAQATVADAVLEVLRQVGEGAPEVARLLAQLTPQERHRVLSQATADGAPPLRETAEAA
jgi:hypothetical protein